jgi:hypothetical protein
MGGCPRIPSRALLSGSPCSDDRRSSGLLEGHYLLYVGSLAAPPRPSAARCSPRTRVGGPNEAPDLLHYLPSGRPDSNRRPSPWQGDAEQTSHLRFLVFPCSESLQPGQRWTPMDSFGLFLLRVCCAHENGYATASRFRERLALGLVWRRCRWFLSIPSDH